MDSFYNTADLKCPFWLNPIADFNPGQKICPNCQTEFEVDDRVECVFINPNNLRLPMNGTVCRVCGLVQGEERDSCGYCGAALSNSVH
jgi:RNA polymerase subunit RPABC4/transcription elongation factor Spt4